MPKCKLKWRHIPLLPICLVLAAVRVAAAADLNDAKKVVSVMMPEKIHAALKTLDTLAAQTLKTSGRPGFGNCGRVERTDHLCQRIWRGAKPDKRMVDADTAFQLASLSKPIATAVLAALVEKGTIHWDDLVVDHDPDLALSNPNVTKMLRAHCATAAGCPIMLAICSKMLDSIPPTFCNACDICHWEIDSVRTLHTRISAFQKPLLRPPARRGNRGRNWLPKRFIDPSR